MVYQQEQQQQQSVNEGYDREGKEANKRKIEDKLKKLREQKKEYIAEAKKLSDKQGVQWHDKINNLAKTMEAEYLLLDQGWLVNGISEEITRVFRDEKIIVSEYVYTFLDDKYKRKSIPSFSLENAAAAATSYLSSSTLAKPSADLLEDFHRISDNFGEVQRDYVAEFTKLGKQIYLKGKRRSELEHIAPEPDENDSTLDQNNSGKITNQTHVTIDKPRPHGSLMFDAIGRAIEKLKKVQQRVFEFPPEILEKDQEIADGWDMWSLWMEPSLDLKYSKNWLDWFRAEKYRDIYGRHASGVMSFSVTNLCANCSDENTREWVRMEPVYNRNFEQYQCLQCGYKLDTICPTCNIPLKLTEKATVGWTCLNCDGNVPMTRDLTREQIGDKSGIIVDVIIEFLKHLPDQIAFCSWYADWVDPLVASRKKRLSGDLSDKA